jgi:hypothetical protein
MSLEGSCLCGGIRFAVHGALPGIVQCHCSLCRRSSGTSGIAKIAIAGEQMQWIAGQDLVATYERPSGYGNAFCRVCGSPAPEGNRDRTRYTVPAGLLADSPALKVTEHIYVASKAHWDIIGGDAPQLDTDRV